MPTTGTQPAKHARFVPYADLPQLNPHLQCLGQVYHQSPKIDALLRKEAENHFAAPEHDLSIHELHLQPVPGDQLPAGGQRIGPQRRVRSHGLEVLSGCSTQHRLQRGCGFVFGRLPGRDGNRAQFRATHGFHNHLVSTDELKRACVEIVDFAAFMEHDTHDIGHQRRASFMLKIMSSKAQRVSTLYRKRCHVSPATRTTAVYASRRPGKALTRSSSR